MKLEKELDNIIDLLKNIKLCDLSSEMIDKLNMLRLVTLDLSRVARVKLRYKNE